MEGMRRIRPAQLFAAVFLVLFVTLTVFSARADAQTPPTTTVPDAPATPALKFKPQVSIPGFNVPADGVTVTSDLLPNYLNAFYIYFMGVVGVIAVAMMVFGGFRWITAAGNSSRISAAKETLNSAAIGLVLALTSFLILRTINPNLVTLRIPAVSLIERNLVSSAYCDQGSGSAREAAQSKPCGDRVQYTDADGNKKTCVATTCSRPGEYCFYSTKINSYNCVTPQVLCENEDYSDEKTCQDADRVIQRYNILDNTIPGNPMACRKARRTLLITINPDDKCYLRAVLHCPTDQEQVACNIGGSARTACWTGTGPTVSPSIGGVLGWCTQDTRAADTTDSICCLKKADIRCQADTVQDFSWVEVTCAKYMPSCRQRCFAEADHRSHNP